MFNKNHPATKDSKIGLQKISGCDNSNRKGDVIFVHGLGGHALSTWHSQEKFDKNSWPFWLGEELPDIGIWSFGYEAEFSSYKGKSMPRFDQAGNLLEWLKIYHIGERPLIFITHSLGGLLVKETLRTAQTFRNQAFLKQVKGTAFLATPHNGSHLANTVNILDKLLQTTVNVEELKAHNPWLRDLDEWYRQNICELGGLPKVYYETQNTCGYKVVDEDSANPKIADVKSVAVPANHISIAKPESPEAFVYLSVREYIQECLRTPLQLPISNSTYVETFKKEELDRISNPQ